MCTRQGKTAKVWNAEQYKLVAGTARILGIGSFTTLALPEVTARLLGTTATVNINSGPIPEGWLFAIGVIGFILGEVGAFTVLKRIPEWAQ